MSKNCGRKALQILWAFGLAVLIPVMASAGDKESRVKGGCLFNFTKAEYVVWPATAFADSKAPFVICILGDDPFGAEFDEAMKGQTSQDRPITLRRVKRAEDAAGCHILFVSRSEGRFLPAILKQFKDANVLTVGESGSFARQGGVIEFVIVDGKVRFAINVEAERRAGLKISSELKRSAVEIVRE